MVARAPRAPRVPCALLLLVLLALLAALGARAVPLPSPRIVLTAPWTAFDAQGAVNLLPIAREALFAARSGANFVWVNGGMAQWEQLSTGERMDIATEWTVEGHANGLFVCIHVGGLSVVDAQKLARHAEAIGADAVAMIPPFVPSASSLQTVVDMCAEVAAVTSLPFFYYHIPGTSGYNYQMHDFLALASSSIPTLAGIKFVSSDFNDFYSCLQYAGGRYAMLWAPEPKLAAMPFGARHVVLAESYFGPYVTAMLDAYERGDLDGALQAQLRRDDLASVMQGAGKDVLTMLGMVRRAGARLAPDDDNNNNNDTQDMGPPRLPLLPMPRSQYDAVQSALERWGFFNGTAAAWRAAS